MATGARAGRLSSAGLRPDAPPTKTLQAALHTRPHLFPLLPALAIACIAAIVPLGLYVGCAADFGDVNPATPGGYVAVVRKTYRAFGENRATGTVGAKDL